MKYCVVITGVGGQGVLLASRLLMDAALADGYDVKGSELHGMSQRGGCVDCHVRFGDNVASPRIPAGTADFLLALEQFEALRSLSFLSVSGWLLVSDVYMCPAASEGSELVQTEEIQGWLGEHVPRSRSVPMQQLLKEASLPSRSLNIAMIGSLSAMLPLSSRGWLKALHRRIKPELTAPNVAAFWLGRRVMEGMVDDITSKPFLPAGTVRTEKRGNLLPS